MPNQPFTPLRSRRRDAVPRGAVAGGRHGRSGASQRGAVAAFRRILNTAIALLIVVAVIPVEAQLPISGHGTIIGNGEVIVGVDNAGQLTSHIERFRRWDCQDPILPV
ncbi:MAG: hypothetical protein M3461_09205 [Pseudomonadota bacterium]|nr:hypothetical protein [Pseudomonadota bacterium]